MQRGVPNCGVASTQWHVRSAPVIDQQLAMPMQDTGRITVAAVKVRRIMHKPGNDAMHLDSPVGSVRVRLTHSTEVVLSSLFFGVALCDLGGEGVCCPQTPAGGTCRPVTGKTYSICCITGEAIRLPKSTARTQRQCAKKLTAYPPADVPPMSQSFATRALETTSAAEARRARALWTKATISTALAVMRVRSDPCTFLGHPPFLFAVT